ncbi:glycosyltransferase family 4 protein [Bacteroidota bacterium]
MRILMFSYDKNLVAGSPSGDALQRHVSYAEHLDKLDIVIPLSAGKSPAELKINEKLSIYPTGGFKIIAWLRAYLIARRICRAGGVDIVVTQDALLGVPGYLLKREFGCRLQVNALGLEIFNDWWLKESLLHRVYKSIMCWTLRRADLVRTDATRAKTALMERLRLSSERVAVIPIIPRPENIAGFTDAYGDGVRNELLQGKYGRMVLFIGTLEKIKNIPNLLRAGKQVLSAHPGTMFVLIGAGPERDRLEKLSRELGIADNVRFMGVVPYDDIPPYLAACDIFILPSWSEGFPRVLLEATFAAKPIVVTDINGAVDIVTDGESGYIVPLNDSAKLAEKIEELLSNPEKAREMGRRGYENTLKYRDFDSNVNVLVNLWQGMLVSK